MGGYFQGEYLPKIQQVISKTLGDFGYKTDSLKLLLVPTDSYLQGMIGVMRKGVNNILFPAGPIEIIAHGGLSRNNIKQIMNLTVEEAHIASMSENICAVDKLKGIDSKLNKTIAEECFKILPNIVQLN